MCVVEVYAAGDAGAAPVDRIMERSTEVAAALLEQVPECQGAPRELVRSIVGGIQKVIHKRLYRGQEKELLELVPQLWDWIFCYPMPPGPLKATRRRTVKALPFEERQKLATPPERILRALAAVVADKGYPDTTVAEVVERAQTSQRTFYEHFKNKEDAVHDTQEAMFRWGTEEPEYARMGGKEMYAAGKRALDQREVVTEGFEALLAPGYERKPKTPRSQPRPSAAPCTPSSTTTSTRKARRRCRTWCRRSSTSPSPRSSRPRRPTRWRSASCAGRDGALSAVEPWNLVFRQLSVESFELFEIATILWASGEALEADEAAEGRELDPFARYLTLDRAGGNGLVVQRSQAAAQKVDDPMPAAHAEVVGSRDFVLGQHLVVVEARRLDPL
jgi:AcrR family transcriptional regulator